MMLTINAVHPSTNIVVKQQFDRKQFTIARDSPRVNDRNKTELFSRDSEFHVNVA